MGTRHLIILYYKGKYVLAQYGQWDGYPDVQGIHILEFFQKDPANLDKLKSKLHLIQEYTPDELRTISDELEHLQREERANGTYDIDNTPIKRRYPSLDRSTSARILDWIVQADDDKKIAVRSELEFVMDFLFCEWCYVIDLDKDVLEVYSGSDDKVGARSRRFIDLWESDEQYKNEELAERLETPMMLGEFSLANPPSSEQFLNFFNEIADDQERSG